LRAKRKTRSIDAHNRRKADSFDTGLGQLSVAIRATVAMRRDVEVDLVERLVHARQQDVQTYVGHEIDVLVQLSRIQYDVASQQTPHEDQAAGRELACQKKVVKLEEGAGDLCGHELFGG
jgi:hypothetical protein